MKSSGIRVVVRGAVQGVGFRYSAEGVARDLGLSGYIRNRHDGAVETEAFGDPGALARFVDWLRVGPTGATVVSVQTEPLPPREGGSGFEVRR